LEVYVPHFALELHHVSDLRDGIKQGEALAHCPKSAILDGVPVLHVMQLENHLFALELGLGQFSVWGWTGTNFFFDLLDAF
jgi:hypothetical protein